MLGGAVDQFSGFVYLVFFELYVAWGWVEHTYNSQFLLKIC
jgi:hypothetical protein